jgi:hypothetical protein
MMALSLLVAANTGIAARYKRKLQSLKEIVNSTPLRTDGGMNQLRLCIAYFARPDEHEWSSNDTDTPEDWVFTENYFMMLLKVCDSWSHTFIGKRAASSLTVGRERE